MKKISRKNLKLRKFNRTLGTWFGTGLAVKAPGTFGSTGTIPLVMFAAYFGGLWGILIAAVVLFFAGVYVVHETIKDSEEKDPSEIVIDEVVGMLVSFSFVTTYLYHNMHHWWIYLAGFALFRFFDIVKLGPVKYFDKMHNAWGVMLDDVVAGLFAGVCLYGMCYYLI